MAPRSSLPRSEVLRRRLVPSFLNKQRTGQLVLITGVFDRFEEALSAATELVEEGFAPKSLSLMSRADRHGAAQVMSSGADFWALGLSDTFATFAVTCGLGDVTSVCASGPLAAALHDGGSCGNGAFLDALARAGLRRATAWYFVDAVCNGRILLSVHCDESRAHVARQVLDGHGKPVPARGSPGIRLRGRRSASEALRLRQGARSN